MSLADKIINGAAGDRCREAAAVIVTETVGGRLVDQLACSTSGPDWVEINWDATRQTTGHLSGGERRLIGLADSLAAGHPVDLSDTLTGLDSTNGRIVLEAFAHALGFTSTVRTSR